MNPSDKFSPCDECCSYSECYPCKEQFSLWRVLSLIWRVLSLWQLYSVYLKSVLRRVFIVLTLRRIVPLSCDSQWSRRVLSLKILKYLFELIYGFSLHVNDHICINILQSLVDNLLTHIRIAYRKSEVVNRQKQEILWTEQLNANDQKQILNLQLVLYCPMLWISFIRSGLKKRLLQEIWERDYLLAHSQFTTTVKEQRVQWSFASGSIKRTSMFGSSFCSGSQVPLTFSVANAN